MGVLRGAIPVSASFTFASTEIRLTEFDDLFPVNEQRHDFIRLWCRFIMQLGKWRPSHLCYMDDIYDFEFTSEVAINKFEFHSFQIHLWNSIKHLVITLCTDVSICNYKFCCEISRFSKAIKQHVLLTPTYQKQSLHSNSRPRSALQRNPPSWCWNILIGRNMNFAVPSRPKLTF